MINLKKIGNEPKNQIADTFFEDLISESQKDEYGLDKQQDVNIHTDLESYKKAIDKYCFTISFGCMLKIGLLLVGSTLLTIFKIWFYCTYC
jgi:hypothetical protein